MKLVPPHSRVSTRLAIRFALLLVAICAAIFLYFPSRLREISLEGLANEARAIGQVTAHALAAPLVFEDSAAISDVLSSLLKNPVVIMASVQDMHGHEVGRLARKGERAEDAGGHAAGLNRQGGYYHTHTPGLHDGREIGELHLSLSTRDVEREAMHQRMHIFLFSILVFAAAFFAAGVFTGRVLAPLTLVADTARAIARGDTSRRAQVDTGDEIQTLAESFNRMVDQLITAQRALQHANERLEQRVQQRTQQLASEVEERRRAEIEVKASEQKWRSLFERAPIGIALIDANGNVFESNTPLQNMLGYSAAELKGRNICGIVDCEASGLADYQETLLESDINAEAVCHGKTRAINGRIALSAVFNERRELQFVTLMVADLTAQKELEHRFRQAQKLEAIGRLAGGVAHDFNNLLTTINGLSEMIAQEMPESDPRREDVEEIRKAGERAASLTHQLLAFSRQQVLQPRVLDLNAVVNDTATMLKRLIGENIELRTVHNAPGLQIKADPNQMVQVLMNLSVNARDAMPQGGLLEISTGVRTLNAGEAGALELAEPGKYVSLSVRDTGTGIEPETMTHMFEPFYTTKQMGRGTGLGLATVYGIVKQSGGAISVDSELGKGTTFTILLPLHEQEAQAVIAPQPAEPQRGHETILIAEDEPTVRSFVARVLRRAGYRVLEACDGLDALRIAQSEKGRIHLLVTDAIMPRMSGVELILQLRAERPDIMAIVLSGYTRDTMREQGFEMGEHAFLQKPVSPQVLTERVRAVLDRAPRNLESEIGAA